MVDLAEFLLARVDEDNAELIVHRMGCAWITPRWNPTPGACDCGEPRRLGAKADAVRQIVEHYRTRFNMPTRALEILALPYADHPDYRGVWDES